MKNNLNSRKKETTAEQAMTGFSRPKLLTLRLAPSLRNRKLGSLLILTEIKFLRIVNKKVREMNKLTDFDWEFDLSNEEDIA